MNKIILEDWQHDCGDGSGCSCYDEGTSLIVNDKHITGYFGVRSNLLDDLKKLFEVLNIEIEIIDNNS